MSEASASSSLARSTRAALLATLETLQKLEAAPDFAERALEHVALAIGALYGVEAESPTPSAADAGLRSALEDLSQALEALREAPSGLPTFEAPTAAVARALARLYPAVQSSQRQHREMLAADRVPSGDTRALVEMGKLLEAPVPSQRPRTPVTVDESEQRRAVERQLVVVDVGLLSDSNFYTGLSEDVSEGGVFVATNHPLPVGTPVTLFFTLDGGPSIEVSGEVRWLRSADTGVTSGMGVAFGSLRDEDRHAIVAYARSRVPLFHGS